MGIDFQGLTNRIKNFQKTALIESHLITKMLLEILMASQETMQHLLSRGFSLTWTLKMRIPHQATILVWPLMSQPLLRLL